nr:hypothetical protein [Succinivibrionaceae bacterium]
MEEKDIPVQAEEQAKEKAEAAASSAAQAEEETASAKGMGSETGERSKAKSEPESAIDESKYSTFIVKLFPEIVVKSKPVRTRMIRILTGNIRNVFQNSGIRVKVLGNWDRVFVKVPKEVSAETASDILSRIPGIHSFSEVLS